MFKKLILGILLVVLIASAVIYAQPIQKQNEYSSEEQGWFGGLCCRGNYYRYHHRNGMNRMGHHFWGGWNNQKAF